MFCYDSLPHQNYLEEMLPVIERFVSINGEGQNAGKLAAFIRFPGCNLSCSYCDTRWANEAEISYELVSIKELVAFVIESGVHHVTLTGGEPTLQPFLGHLIDVLARIPLEDGSGLAIEIETNGSTDIMRFIQQRTSWDDSVCGSLSLTMDYKLPSSGMEERMHVNNLSSISACDTVKFVAGSAEDLERMREIIMKYELSSKTSVYVSPVFGQLAPADIVEFMKTKGLTKVTLQLQLHKIVWPSYERGV